MMSSEKGKIPTSSSSGAYSTQLSNLNSRVSENGQGESVKDNHDRRDAKEDDDVNDAPLRRTTRNGPDPLPAPSTTIVQVVDMPGTLGMDWSRRPPIGQSETIRQFQDSRHTFKMSAVIHPPELRATAAASGPEAREVDMPIYEESIATGNFKLVKKGDKSRSNVTMNLLQRRLARQSKSADISATEDLSLEVQQYVYTISRLAQGLLVGVCFLDFVQMLLVKSNEAFYFGFGPRFIATHVILWVLTAIGCLSSLCQLMYFRKVLGSFLGPYTSNSSFSALVLVRRVTSVQLATLAYLALAITVLIGMKSASLVDVAVESAQPFGTIESEVVKWFRLVVVRFILSLFAWLLTAWSNSNPAEVHLTVELLSVPTGKTSKGATDSAASVQDSNV